MPPKRPLPKRVPKELAVKVSGNAPMARSASSSTAGSGAHPRSPASASSPHRAVTDADLNRMRKMFNSFDIRGIGVIQTSALRNLLIAAGVDLTAELERMIMDRVDPDGSGDITFVEFMNAFDVWLDLSEDLSGGLMDEEESHYKGSYIKLSDEQLQRGRDLFKELAKGGGSVSSELLRGKIHKNFHTIYQFHPTSEQKIEAETRAVMSVIDADDDGSVSFIEFVKAYWIWLRVEEDAIRAAEINVEIEEMQVLLQEVTEVADRAKEKHDAVVAAAGSNQARLHDISAERRRLENSIFAMMDQETLASDSPSELQMELGDAYRELRYLKQLNPASDKFQTLADAFMRSHPLEEEESDGAEG